MTLFHPAGTLTHESASVVVTPEVADWAYSGLTVFELSEREEVSLNFYSDEVVLVPLRGSFRIDSASLSVTLAGRNDLFSEPTDRAYLPPRSPFVVTSESGGEIAVCSARAETGGPARHLSAAAMSAEVRGAGQATRQINGIWPADVPGPERLIVVEVLTPAGNWSSYPPHKHDEFTENEVPLEEIYYFRIQGEEGFGFHRTYSSDGDIDETVTVRNGDTFLIPRGYHGPCVAAPNYDMYYLNVMAGPHRDWRVSNDPRHAWVTSEWRSIPPDPRVPRW